MSVPFSIMQSQHRADAHLVSRVLVHFVPVIYIANFNLNRHVARALNGKKIIDCSGAITPLLSLFLLLFFFFKYASRERVPNK